MEKRFCQARSIAGTQKIHGFTPLNKNEIKTKSFSHSKESFSFHKISGKKDQVKHEEIRNIPGIQVCCTDEFLL